MEEFINNPGLQHLAEKVFFNLNVEDSKICTHINKSCEQILENPMFWLRKFGDGISKKNQKEWIKIIQSEEKNPKKRKDIIAYMQWNFEKETSVDLPCYSNSNVQEDFTKRIREVCEKDEISDQDIDIVKIVAPLTDNPNAPDELGKTPISCAAENGHTEIVKILAPLTKNPNANCVIV